MSYPETERDCLNCKHGNLPHNKGPCATCDKCDHWVKDDSDLECVL